MSNSFGCLMPLIQLLFIVMSVMGVIGLCGYYHVSYEWSMILALGTLAGSIYVGLVGLRIFFRWLDHGKRK